MRLGGPLTENLTVTFLNVQKKKKPAKRIVTNPTHNMTTLDSTVKDQFFEEVVSFNRLRHLQ